MEGLKRKLKKPPPEVWPPANVCNESAEFIVNFLNLRSPDLINKMFDWRAPIDKAGHQRSLAILADLRKAIGGESNKHFYAELNEKLAKYPAVWRIDRDWSGALGLLPTSYGDGDAGAEPESYIVLIALDVLRAGLYGRIRRCACGEWFFAIRDNQTAHSHLCRQKKYEDKDAVKKKRLLYMKWYYAMYQSPNAPKKKMTYQQWLKQNKSKGEN